MVQKVSSTINLGLADIPEINDAKLFPEFLRLYNAIKILAMNIDSYTSDGTVVTTVESISTDTNSSIDSLTLKLRQFNAELQQAISLNAQVAELRKQYRRYTVPTFTVTGAFGTNGKTPQVSFGLGAVTTTVPAGGVGTAAGGWDTAANRDAAIAAINAHSTAINNIQTALKNNGIGS